jgi:hypothetical protein
MSDKPSSVSTQHDIPMEVVDEGSLHKYRTEIPNTIVRGHLGHGLSVHAKWLYVYLKSVAGDSGVCRQGTSTLAKGSGMSRGMVSQSKTELLDARLIVVTKGNASTRETDKIRIRDIWPMNMQEFATVHIMNSHPEFVTPNVQNGDATTVHNMNTPVHDMNTPVHNMAARRSLRRRSRGSPPSLSPPHGGDTEQENLFAHVEGYKNGTDRGNNNAERLTPDEAQSVPDADPAAPVYVLTGDGTYAITTKSTRLSRHPAHQDRLYRAITEDATFADWYAAHGITGDLEQRWQDFVLWALDDNKRSGDWGVAFKRWLKGGPLETKRRTAPAEPRKKGDLAAYLRANKEEASA